MTSEGLPSVSIHVTGFKKFQGVVENPSEWIVSNLEEFLKKKKKLNGLGSCSALVTAGVGALPTLCQLLESASSKNDGQRVIWIHFGVSSGANKFAIEHQAVNEAMFCCPDDMGWQPKKEPIVPDDGSISLARERH